ncbi:MAG: hypothetical protein A3B34_03265 [Candidatus Sungbacteria bacterium RIFCSPLOWO2_01_FULL_54_21]|uniref:DUF5678 domain-containing protein n=2 Tax=Candidatus Sungiibacteriota TaxID=1817917 RepID=A0A1G2L979_9BACT|nr:MAG: hypothetical protein A2679_01740 [Candidatus Sungbacteria bacterium RIFCSPHIGHO2_01_FULL_54_26]OHA02777.1 MAG: hypothetical protein A3C92_00785 [Candidatus Sungbacteria bacterium RIFCSPHIGHO2_02_FULL_53_17]OHA08198.1 MAG: hypothetical protein A3B34_03265 [Candidatus Sungbacteria bacterium RIFCSPLOWO2_01_FULL_54_21]
MSVQFKTQKKTFKLDRYAGEWVAFAEGRVIEHHKELPLLMDALRERRLEKKASVLLVPRKDEGPYILAV